jgi:hypothetical protein
LEDRVDLLLAVPLISLDKLAGAWVDRFEVGSLRFPNRAVHSGKFHMGCPSGELIFRPEFS